AGPLQCRPVLLGKQVMALSAGSRLGPYEILTLVGSGGMGEVYRARDATLGRDIALKILPPEFALDPARLARFKREAQLLASLNHPRVAAIYGFEESGGIQALVLELVEGPTLADRIARGPIPLVQTPFDERNGIIFPDGHWLAYEANDSGVFEIHVRPF